MKRFGVISFVLLIISEVCLLWNKVLDHQEIILKNNSISELSAENMAISSQFEMGLANNGVIIDRNIELRDINGDILSIGDLFDEIDGNVFICRYSEQCCWECVNLAVKKLLASERNFDMKRVLFLADCQQRILPRQIKELGLDSCKVYNCHSLSIPAESIMYPYYMVLDKTLYVKSVYFPSKTLYNSSLDSVNLNLVYRYCID